MRRPMVAWRMAQERTRPNYWLAAGVAGTVAAVVWWLKPRGPGVPGLSPGGKGFAEPGPGDSEEQATDRRAPPITVTSPKGREPTAEERAEYERRNR